MFNEIIGQSSSGRCLLAAGLEVWGRPFSSPCSRGPLWWLPLRPVDDGSPNVSEIHVATPQQQQKYYFVLNIIIIHEEYNNECQRTIDFLLTPREEENKVSGQDDNCCNLATT